MTRYFAADFETTVWGEEIEKERGIQTKTEVWSAAIVELYDNTESVNIFGNIGDFIDYLFTLKGKTVIYFHNLGFDGSFILDYLMKEGWEWVEDRRKMRSRTISTNISELGVWYNMYIKKGMKRIEIRDSYRLIPNSLRKVGEAFNTKHKKLDMVYEGLRFPNCPISDEEKEYIKNDVLVLKEALEYMFNEGHYKLTIGSCCMDEFKKTYDDFDFKTLFPDLSKQPIESLGISMWEYVHRAYMGGWCYVNSRTQGKVVSGGAVYDVNSLYPSVMHSISRNRYPIGLGEYRLGAPTNIGENELYFIRVKCRFKLKESKLPWVHIRGSALYNANECLETSDVRYKGEYYRYYYDEGERCDTAVEMSFTDIDWELFNETYEIYDLEYLDYAVFRSEIGVFDKYINKYKQIKETSIGFKRYLAKLFLNNLYGKLCSNDDSSYKLPFYDKDEKRIKFDIVEDHNKGVGYIAAGAYVTSYARNFTIKAAIDNFRNFLYADTDSIHVLGNETPEGINIHDTDFLCWKKENTFKQAQFYRQKCYIEEIYTDKGTELSLKVAGMSKEAKEKYIEMGYGVGDLTDDLIIQNANLKAERIEGGILLRNKDYKIRKSVDKKVVV